MSLVSMVDGSLPRATLDPYVGEARTAALRSLLHGEPASKAEPSVSCFQFTNDVFLLSFEWHVENHHANMHRNVHNNKVGLTIRPDDFGSGVTATHFLSSIVLDSYVKETPRPLSREISIDKTAGLDH